MNLIPPETPKGWKGGPVDDLTVSIAAWKAQMVEAGVMDVRFDAAAGTALEYLTWCNEDTTRLTGPTDHSGVDGPEMVATLLSCLYDMTLWAAERALDLPHRQQN